MSSQGSKMSSEWKETGSCSLQLYNFSYRYVLFYGSFFRWTIKIKSLSLFYSWHIKKINQVAKDFTFCHSNLNFPKRSAQGPLTKSGFSLGPPQVLGSSPGQWCLTPHEPKENFQLSQNPILSSIPMRMTPAQCYLRSLFPCLSNPWQEKEVPLENVAPFRDRIFQGDHMPKSFRKPCPDFLMWSHYLKNTQCTPLNSENPGSSGNPGLSYRESFP